MKLIFAFAVLFSSLAVSASEKTYCGRITHITLHQIEGKSMYNFGMAYGFGGVGSNSFGWLNPKIARESEILELIKYAKANKLTFCTEFGMPEDGKISVE